MRLLFFVPCVVLAAVSICLVVFPRGTITGVQVRRGLLAVAGAGIGITIGVLLNNVVLAAALGGVGLLAPIWFGKIMERTGQRAEDEQLEVTLSIVTSTYVQSQDFVQAVRSNLSRIPAPFSGIFRRFLRELTIVSPSIKSGLYAIRNRYEHPRWREWIDAVAQCQDDRTLVYTLPPIVAELGDSRRMSAEVATAIAGAWRDYLIIAGLMIGQIPLLRMMNDEWYGILTSTFGGQVIIFFMFASVVISAYAVFRINKPINF